MIRVAPALLLAMALSACALLRDATDEHDMTALMRAARDGDTGAVAGMLADGARVDQQVRGHSALREILAFLAWMQSLPSRDAGYTALHYAAAGARNDVVAMLLASEARTDLVADAGETPLSLAAWTGDLETVRTLLEAGAPARRPPDLPQAHAWQPPLTSIARSRGNTDLVGLLLEHGADPDEPPQPLFPAAMTGDTVVVRVLLDAGAAPDPLAPDGRTPLMGAAEAGHLEVVRLLMAAGADPTRRDQRAAWTPAQWAASRGHEDVVAALEGDHDDSGDLAAVRLVMAVQTGDEVGVHVALAEGASPLTRTSFGGPLLGVSVARGDVGITRALLEAGADVRQTESGDIPHLQRAAQAGKAELVELLLQAGADPRAPGTAVLAAGGGNLDIVRRLHGAGAPIREGADEPLRAAAIGGHLEVVRYLLAQGALVDARDATGRTALGRAAAFQAHGAVRLLLEAGADPRQADPESGWTPLMGAAMAGDSLLIRILVDAGADPGARDQEGRSAADYARGAGNGHVVPLLIRRGGE